MAENDLARIADDPSEVRAYTKFWGDQYVVAGAALRTMRDLLLIRLQEVDREIARVKDQERAAPATGTSVPTGENDG